MTLVSESERLDAEQRAEIILTHIRGAHPGYPRTFQQEIDMIAAQISEAEDAAELRAYRSSDETWKKRIEKAEREAYVDVKDWELKASAEMKKIQFELGFHAAREKAKGIAETTDHPVLGMECCGAEERIADRIGKMEPDK